jgi:hypothetical protein
LNSKDGISRELLRIRYFRGLDFAELWKRAESWCFWLASAAAGGSGENEGGSDGSNKNADHENE